MLRRRLIVGPSATPGYTPLPGPCFGIWSARVFISAKAVNNKIDTLETERDALEQQLAAPGISEAKEIAIHRQIIATTNEITALYGKLPNVSEPPKTIKYQDEDGEEKHRTLDAAGFERWLGSHALVPVPLGRDGDAASETQLRKLNTAAPTREIMLFDDIDEAGLYYRSNKEPLEDIEICVQHLVDVQQLEFGKKCRELLATSPAFNTEAYDIVTSAQGGSKNPFAHRPSPSSPFEVDFFAKNGSHSVAGMFQLTMPRNEKITSFFNTCKELDPPATKFIFGVSLANAADLARIKEKFDATLVRSATGFHLLQ